MNIILVNREDAHIVEQEEKTKWALSVMEKMGLDMSDLARNPTMDNLRRMRAILKKNDIDIIDVGGEDLEIYYNNTLIAEWIKPRYILKEDTKERSPKYRFYLEMHLNSKIYLDKYVEKGD